VREHPFVMVVGRSRQSKEDGHDLPSQWVREELDQAEGAPDRLLLCIDPWEELYAQPCSGTPCLLFGSLTKLSRDEMRLAGYPDNVPEIDVCASGQ
jgi:hypothetical protein